MLPGTSYARMSMSETRETIPPQSAGAKSSAGGGRRHRGRRGGRGRPRPPQARSAPTPEAITAPEAAPFIERVAALTERVAAKEATPHTSAISQALDEVMQIVESLKRAAEQMEEVLELVELAERQKLSDEQEIESLRRALRQLQRPRGPRSSEEVGHSS